MIESLPVDEDGNVPEEYLRERNDARSKRSRNADKRSTAKRVYPKGMPPEQAVSWISNPGRSDVEGIDTRSKANIKRREPKAKAPTKPPEKPASPKGRKAPVYVLKQEPGEVVSGAEIVQIAELAVALGSSLPLYQAVPMITCDGVNVALYIGKPCTVKTLFGVLSRNLDYCIPDPKPMTKLDKRSLYKVTSDGAWLKFAKGPDFSKEVLKVPLGLGDQRYSSNIDMVQDRTDRASYLDCQALAVAVRQMVDVNVSPCILKVEDESLQIQASAWNCGIRAEIGCVGNAKGYSATFSPAIINNLLKATGSVYRVILFGRNCPMVLSGSFGRYNILVSIPNLEGM